MGIYTWSPSPEEEAEFEKVMTQARKDARAFGISQRFKAYLEQLPPKERMLHILAMHAELENQLELCQRLLCVQPEAKQPAHEKQNPSENLPNRSQARNRPTKVVPPQFEEWHPTHVKTVLKNRRIGRKVSVQLRKRP